MQYLWWTKKMRNCFIAYKKILIRFPIFLCSQCLLLLEDFCILWAERCTLLAIFMKARKGDNQNTS